MSGISGFKTTITATGFSAATQVRSFTGLTQDAEDIDVTHYNSPETEAGSKVGYREFIPGMIDPGEAEMEIVFSAAGALELYAVIGEILTWTITLNNDDTIGFDGYISSVGWAIPYDDAVIMSATLRVTGKVTFTDTP